ncbi:MAG: protein kinase [Planctomycetaceae bacterium]|nr:protein kinase [Planctomycetales bacterium]MCB9922907.1 protein kinase [Planctomycetaceae bacterium]
MKEVHMGRATQAANQGAASTWRVVAKNGRPPIKIAVGHLAKEQKLDDALDEYCRLREQDRSITASQFCNRYPSYRHSLRRLIDVHEALEHQPALEEENWPELFSDFLGYEIIHELGVGAIARVYLAAETALGGRLVALKVSQHGGDEAETLGKLTHPNVVPVFSVKHDENTDMTAVCMPYHGSATLADVLEIAFENGRPPTSARVIIDAARAREQVVGFVGHASTKRTPNAGCLRGTYVDGVARLGIQMAEALAYTHERGILHRDLKPSNVLLTPDGVPMLLDFNLASDLELGAGRLGGTLPYMPPEQIRDVHLQPFEADAAGDPRSDVFSLGVILYELLAGKLPFGDPQLGISPSRAAEAYLRIQREQAPTSLAKCNPQVPPTLAKTIDRCLSWDVESRPQTANELATELRRQFGLRAKLGRFRLLALVFIAIAMLGITGQIRHSLLRIPDYTRHMDLALAALEAGEYAQATQHFDDAENAEGMATVPVLFGRGYSYEQRRMMPIALSEQKLASELSRDPLVTDCYAHLAAINGNYISAIIGYQQANERDGDYAMRYVSLAHCKRLQGSKPELAILDLDKALELDPNLQIAYHSRANAYRDAVDRTNFPLSKAIVDIETAIRIGPTYAQLQYDAARIYSLAAAEDPKFFEEIQLHLSSAIDLGLHEHNLDRIAEFEHLKEHDWFAALAERSRIGEPPKEPPRTPPQMFVAPATSEVIDWLRMRI